MKNSLREALKKPVHDKAKEHVRLSTLRFANAVLLQSKAIAVIDGADEVHVKHVVKANEAVLSMRSDRKRLRDAALLVGGALVGIFVPIVIEQSLTTSDSRPYLLIGGMFAVIVSVVLVMYGLRRL